MWDLCPKKCAENVGFVSQLLCNCVTLYNTYLFSNNFPYTTIKQPKPPLKIKQQNRRNVTQCNTM